MISPQMRWSFVVLSILNRSEGNSKEWEIALDKWDLIPGAALYRPHDDFSNALFVVVLNVGEITLSV